MDEVPFILSPGILTTAWGSVVTQLAAGLDLTLDEIVEWHERVPAPEAFDVASGRIEAGTTAAMRFEIRGVVGGQTKVVVEHVTRLRDDLAPDWPQPTGHGGYRIVLTGEPNYTVDMQMLGSDGDHNTAGLKATAMRLVNSVAAVVEAPPGLLSALDLPLVTGRGLVS
jgi:4-hydroxy-tetrahydrodipicolinate reductase